MTGHIIPLHGDRHNDSRSLLPWYVTGQLDADDLLAVEAHLNTCAQCQADLAIERRLATVIANMTPDLASGPSHADAYASGDDSAGTQEALIEQNWAKVASRLNMRTRHVAGAGRLRRMGHQWQASAPWLRWAVAAQFAFLLAGGAALFGLGHKGQPVVDISPQYHVLGARPESAAGNVVVVFRPETSEHDLRQTLRDNHARLVDGPTVADAYILSVPSAGRNRTVDALRRQATIVLAEPIDGPQASTSAMVDASGAAP